MAAFGLSATEARSLGITEVTLANGMKVILKPTDFDSDEVFVRITAQGGYAALPKEQYTTGELATQIAWESGLGNSSADQISALLYEYSIEWQAKIQPYSRMLEGSCEEEGLMTYFELVHKFFNEPRFTQEGFQTAINQVKEGIQKRRQDFETHFDDAVKAVNTQERDALHSFTAADVEKVQLDSAKKIYQEAFANPAEFVCVIVGSFDREKLMPALQKYLGSIAKKEGRNWNQLQTQPKFPTGVSSHVVAIHTRADCLTQITFPLTADLDDAKLHLVELTCQVMEGRLRQHFRKTLDTSFGVDVGYEFPFYPMTNSPWLTIQFRSEPQKIKPLTDAIIAQIQKLQEEGPTPEELREAKAQQKRSDEFWLKDNYFWAVALSNYYLWGWNPTSILQNVEDKTPFTRDECKKVMTKQIKVDNYSIISAKPQ